jgi:hypothetical protein
MSDKYGRLTHREFKAAAGGSLRVTVYETGSMQLTRWGDIPITYPLTREDAVKLAKNLEEIVAAYDATVDRYHDVCDEPVAAEVRC